MFKYFFGNKPKPSKSKYEFKLMYSFDERKKESLNIIKKYKNMIPVIVEKSDQTKLHDIDKHKFLFRRDLTFGDIVTVIRKRLKVNSSQTVHLFIKKDKVSKTSNNLGNLYRKYRDKDMFLYITYA